MVLKSSIIFHEKYQLTSEVFDTYQHQMINILWSNLSLLHLELSQWLAGRLQTRGYGALLFFSVLLIWELLITHLGIDIYCYSYACRDCCDLLFVSQQAQSDHVHTCQALFAFRIWWPHPNSLLAISVPMQTPKLRISPTLLITSGQNHVWHHFNYLRVQRPHVHTWAVLNLQVS